MVSQQRLIDEYESLRRLSFDRVQRTTQGITLALRAVMEGGMVAFMRCCAALLSHGPVESDASKPVPRVRRAETPLPSVQLTHALTAMVLAIVSQEQSQ